VQEPTELELRLEARITDDIKPERVYHERWSRCQHAFRRLGEIGPVLLDECLDCGLVVGIAR
jgi:hypothetical protein